MEDVEEIASRIISSIAQPFESRRSHAVFQCQYWYRAKSGSVIKTPMRSLRDADAAMYQAKSLGRGRYVFFDDSMREKLIASMTLEQELRHAIKTKQFDLVLSDKFRI